MRVAARFACLIAVGVVLAPGPLSAQAPDVAKTVEVCRNRTDGVYYGLPEQLAACAALIESGTVTGGELAKVLYLRGTTRLFAAIQDDPNPETVKLAINDLSEAIQLAPQYTAAYYYRGVAYNRRNDYDRAIADFTEALRLDPAWGAPSVQRDLAEQGKKGLIDVAKAYSDINQPNPLDAGGHVPASVVPPAHSVDESRRLCDGDIDRRGYGPDQVGPDLTIAECTAAIRMGNLSQAALARELTNRSTGFTAFKQYDRALADDRQAVQLDPNNSTAHLNLGVDVANKGDLQSGIREFQTTLKLDPNEDAALNNLCVARGILGRDLDQAHQECDAAIRLKKDPDYFDSRGLVELKQKQFDAARKDYAEAARLNPDDASYWFGQGIADLRLGNAAQGLLEIEKAKSLDPEIEQTYAEQGVRR